MLRIDALPAGNGDSIWIEYGERDSLRRILVDGGTGGAWDGGLRARIQSLDPDDRRFELLVITHIDADHIDGALALLEDDALGASFGEVWFNGWRHLPETPLESLGPVAGERVTDSIVSREIPWNAAFDGRAVAVRSGRPLPAVGLPGGLTLTVLSPTAEQLAVLKPVWRTAVEAAGLDRDKPREATPEDDAAPGLEVLGVAELPDVATLSALPFAEDRAEPNGSSIVLLLEHDGRHVLLTGDCFPSVVTASLSALGASEQDRLHVDVVKVPHHGSRSNVSLPFLRLLDCSRFIFSSNGSRTKHPHRESVARVLAVAGEDSELLFNYRTEFNEVWDNDDLKEAHSYRTVYASDGDAASISFS